MGRIKDGSQQSTGSVELANTQTCSRSTTICGFCPICSEVYNQFNTLTAPLTNLTKVKIGLYWQIVEQEAFDKLKVIVCSKLVLRLPKFTKPFKIHSDAFDLAYVVVVIEEGILLLMNLRNSQTCNFGARWPTDEKEMH